MESHVKKRFSDWPLSLYWNYNYAPRNKTKETTSSFKDEPLGPLLIHPGQQSTEPIKTQSMQI